MRRAEGVTLSGVTIKYDNDEGEGRPAFVLSDVSDITFDGVKALRPDDGTAVVDYDVGLRGECKDVSVGDLVTKKIGGSDPL